MKRIGKNILLIIMKACAVAIVAILSYELYQLHPFWCGFTIYMFLEFYRYIFNELEK